MEPVDMSIFALVALTLPLGPLAVLLGPALLVVAPVAALTL